MAEDNRELDLTQDPSEQITNDSERVSSFTEKKYNPQIQEDSARRRIAYILLGLLTGVLLWALLSVTFCPESEEKIINVLQIVLGPIIALVSAATGFYFGAKTNNN